ncbi:hypothetical protein GCM10028796_40090 [Ramlibacter monticola]|uniref:DUF2846 domain-containing protein n=1 Tax=Ramlibacter monticola TaxID=1926872 RepID=A0A936Z1S7_9BURK|nr:DUF2846 domain-containing protein [Ramlibacter monticola]MBL0393425.1 DUF2846 domain-containing protein [Ramlibacter monticola]
MRRTILKLACAAAAAVLVSGCATGPKHDEIASSIPSLKAGQSRIYFFRSSTFGAAVQPDIRLNGEVVGQSKPNGFFFVDRPAGNFLASASTETEKTLSFVTQPGETKYIRSFVSFGLMVGRVNLEPETPEKAKADLATLSFTGKLAGK